MSRNLLLMNDTTNWYHYGCTITSTALKEEINALGFNLTALPITETYKIQNFPRNDEEFDSINYFTKFSQSNSDLLDYIKYNDILVINGEGTIHGTQRNGPLALLYTAFCAKKFLNKHVEIINHSVYPQDNLSLDDMKATALYKTVYSSLDFAAIREPLSLNVIKKLGVKATQSFDCMPLFIKKHYKLSNFKSNKTLLIAGSAAWLNLDMLSDAPGDIEKYKQGFTQFFKYIKLMIDQGFTVYFLYGAKAYPSKFDQAFIQYLIEQDLQEIQILEARSMNEWLIYIEQATLLVSGRFHHSLAAACLGTPFITLNSNTPKIEGLLRVLGNGEVLNYEDHNLFDKLLGNTAAIPNNLPIKQRIQTLNKLCKMAKNNFQMLATI